MTTGTVTYSGLLLAKGATYTQKRGVRPDRIQVKMIPQTSSIAAIGDLTLAWNGDPITLPDCLADKSHIWLTDNGFIGTIVFEDRRWRWSRFPRFSAHYNERDPDGEIVEDTRASVQEILADLFGHINETNADVSLAPAGVYPEINAQCRRADVLIDELTQNFGLHVCLGFGSDPVAVYPEGVGTALPFDGRVMAASEEVDPPTPPKTFQVCFGPSVAQARFKLAPLGVDLDNSIKPIDDLSYTPADGWHREPMDMPNVNVQHGVEAWNLARQTVYKMYGIDTFADGTLNYPDGSGALNDIKQVLPLGDKLLETTQRDGKFHHPAVRVFGKHLTYSFPSFKLTEISDPIQEGWKLNFYRGIVTFEEQMYFLDGTGTSQQAMPAELYLEAKFRIRDSFNHQFVAYVWETGADPNGQGYYTFHEPGLYARTVVQYDDNQAVSDIITNQATLDGYATSIANGAAGLYTSSSRYMSWYNRPMSGLRTDGLTSQVRHVISDGTDGEPGHYTVAAQGTEFDIFSRTSREVRVDAFVETKSKENIAEVAAEPEKRVEKGND